MRPRTATGIALLVDRPTALGRDRPQIVPASRRARAGVFSSCGAGCGASWGASWGGGIGTGTPGGDEATRDEHHHEHRKSISWAHARILVPYAVRAVDAAPTAWACRR